MTISLLTLAFATISLAKADFVLIYDGFNYGTTDGWKGNWDQRYFNNKGETVGTVSVDTTNQNLIVQVTGAHDITDGVWGISLLPKGLTLSGEFLLQVDYTLVHNDQNIRIGLGDDDFAGTTWLNFAFLTDSGNHFSIDFKNSGDHYGPYDGPSTTYRSGSLRIIRDSVGVINAYYKDDSVSDWTEAFTVIGHSGNLHPTLGFWNDQSTFTDQDNQVVFDNFYVISGTSFVVPEYGYGTLLALAACFAAYLAFKKPWVNPKHD